MSLHEVYSNVDRGKGPGWFVARGWILRVSDPDPQYKSFCPTLWQPYSDRVDSSGRDHRGHDKPLMGSYF